VVKVRPPTALDGTVEVAVHGELKAVGEGRKAAENHFCLI
jgi:hypothetical protein